MTTNTIQVRNQGNLIVLTVGDYPEITITVIEALKFTGLIEGAIATAQALISHVTTVH